MAKPTDGTCCSCGYTGSEETPCKEREDETHCNHWWDVGEVPTGPLKG